MNRSFILFVVLIIVFAAVLARGQEVGFTLDEAAPAHEIGWGSGKIEAAVAAYLSEEASARQSLAEARRELYARRGSRDEREAAVSYLSARVDHLEVTARGATEIRERLRDIGRTVVTLDSDRRSPSGRQTLQGLSDLYRLLVTIEQEGDTLVGEDSIALRLLVSVRTENLGRLLLLLTSETAACRSVWESLEQAHAHLGVQLRGLLGELDIAGAEIDTLLREKQR